MRKENRLKIKKINIGHEIREGLKEIKSWRCGDTKLKVSKIELRDFVPFVISDYIDNPIALARIKAGVSQEQLADLLKVTKVYIRKIEQQDVVKVELLNKVKAILSKLRS